MESQEKELLAQILEEVERITAMQHDLARRKRILAEAATRLRLGQSASGVLDHIQKLQDGAEPPREIRRSA